MKYNKCLLVLSALAAVAFTGCKNEDVEKHRFENKFYITSTILSDDLLINRQPVLQQDDKTPLPGAGLGKCGTG